MAKKILVLGSFVADVAFRAARLPAWGETLMGSGFALGPGGKGSNQAVAAARAGAEVQMLSRLGDDAFGRLARETWAADGIDASLTENCATATGSAVILIDEVKGENAIIVVPGACFTLRPKDVEAAGEAIRCGGGFADAVGAAAGYGGVRIAIGARGGRADDFESGAGAEFE